MSEEFLISSGKLHMKHRNHKNHDKNFDQFSIWIYDSESFYIKEHVYEALKYDKIQLDVDCR